MAHGFAAWRPGGRIARVIERKHQTIKKSDDEIKRAGAWRAAAGRCLRVAMACGALALSSIAPQAALAAARAARLQPVKPVMDGYQASCAAEMAVDGVVEFEVAKAHGDPFQRPSSS